MNSSDGSDLILLRNRKPKTVSASLMGPPPFLVITISAGPKMKRPQLTMDMVTWKSQRRTLSAVLALQQVMTLKI